MNAAETSKRQRLDTMDEYMNETIDADAPLPSPRKSSSASDSNSQSLSRLETFFLENEWTDEAKKNNLAIIQRCEKTWALMGFPEDVNMAMTLATHLENADRGLLDLMVEHCKLQHRKRTPKPMEDSDYTVFSISVLE